MRAEGGGEGGGSGADLRFSCEVRRGGGGGDRDLWQSMRRHSRPDCDRCGEILWAIKCANILSVSVMTCARRRKGECLTLSIEKCLMRKQNVVALKEPLVSVQLCEHR